MNLVKTISIWNAGVEDHSSHVLTDALFRFHVSRILYYCIVGATVMHYEPDLRRI